MIRVIEMGTSKRILLDIRGWLEIREELTEELERFLDQPLCINHESKPDEEDLIFIHKGWSTHLVNKGNSYFFSYLYYGGNIYEDCLPYFLAVVAHLADEFNYWDGPMRVYPTGEFVIEEGEGEWIRRWKVEDGKLTESTD